MSSGDGTVAAVPKAGWQSTELYVTLVTMAQLAIPAIPEQYHALIAAVGGVYVAARTLLKVVHTLGYAKGVPDLPALPALPAGTTQTQTTVTQVPKN